MKFSTCSCMIVFIAAAILESSAVAGENLNGGFSLFAGGGYDSNPFLDPDEALANNLPEPLETGFMRANASASLRLKAGDFFSGVIYSPLANIYTGSSAGVTQKHSADLSAGLNFNSVAFGAGLEGEKMIQSEYSQFDYLFFAPYIFAEFNPTAKSTIYVYGQYGSRSYQSRETVELEKQKNDELAGGAYAEIRFHRLFSPQVGVRLDVVDSNDMYSSHKAITGYASILTMPSERLSINLFGGATSYKYDESRSDVSLVSSLKASIRLWAFTELAMGAEYMFNQSDVSWGDFDKLSAFLGLTFFWDSESGAETNKKLVPEMEITSDVTVGAVGDKVIFSYCSLGENDDVKLIGTMNDWGKADVVELEYNEETRCFAKEMQLLAGEYRYVYLVNGERSLPPNVFIVVPDGFGGENGLLIVEKRRGINAESEDKVNETD